MKNYFYLLICSGIFLASCKSSSHEIPYKPVPDSIAVIMANKYQKVPPTADTNYREVPRLISFDAETLESFTEKNKEGKVVAVKFIIAAYLDERPTYLKNTMLLLIVRGEKEKKTNYWYDLRSPWDPKKDKPLVVDPNNTVCPPPMDCGNQY